MSQVKRQLVIFLLLGTSFLLGTIVSDFVARTTSHERQRVPAPDPPIHSIASSHGDGLPSTIDGP